MRIGAGGFDWRGVGEIAECRTATNHESRAKTLALSLFSEITFVEEFRDFFRTS
jgi:hypothetical protein